MVKEKIAESIELLTLFGTIFVAVFFLLFLHMIIFKKQSPLLKEIVSFISKHYILFGFIVSFLATSGSLFYSEIMKYSPCILCWYQRIFMYPQTILFLIAMRFKDKTSIIVNSVILSTVGLFLAIYHYLGQIGIMTLGTCDAVGYSASCSEFFSLSYGFITIPMMAIVAFLLIIIFGACVQLNKKH